MIIAHPTTMIFDPIYSNVGTVNENDTVENVTISTLFILSKCNFYSEATCYIPVYYSWPGRTEYI